MLVPMKLSELGLVELSEVVMLNFQEAPVSFLIGRELVGWSMTIFGPVPVMELKFAEARNHGELAIFEGATYAMQCGDDVVAYDLCWN